MDLFKNKYRVATSRLQSHNYREGVYFVTICVVNNKNYFGKVRNQKVFLSEVGKLAECFWQKIPDHFTSVKLDEFVIMPDHLHGILILGGGSDGRDVALQRLYGKSNSSPLRRCGKSNSSPLRRYGKSNSSPLRRCGKSNSSPRHLYAEISPKFGSLAVVIRSFKSICTREINKKYPELNFSWQERFYDSIIRSSQDLQRVRCYIKNNPRNWLK